MNKFLSKTLLIYSLITVEIFYSQYVELPDMGIKIEDFVPTGWKIEQSESGDLGGDGSKDDYILLLRMQDENNIFHDKDCSEPLDTNPRMLVFLLARNGNYFMAGQNNTLITSSGNFCTGDDPIDGISGGGISIGGKNGREGIIDLGFFGSPIVLYRFSFAWLNEGSKDKYNYGIYLLERTYETTSRYDQTSKTVHVDYIKQCTTYTEDDNEGNIIEQTEPFVSEGAANAPLIRLEEVEDPWSFNWGKFND